MAKKEGVAREEYASSKAVSCTRVSDEMPVSHMTNPQPSLATAQNP
jgi:hypothetical protein